MSNSLKRPVVRAHKSSKVYKPSNYRKALFHLLKDFDNRCAYSMVHVSQITKTVMEVDHFDSSKKHRCNYTNLFPAHSTCNRAKGKDAKITGPVRLLNPCTDVDYGGEIFEDPKTHELVATTPSGEYHIDVLDLNNEDFVKQRKERSVLLSLANSYIAFSASNPGNLEIIQEALSNFSSLISTKIPEIPPPPQKK